MYEYHKKNLFCYSKSILRSKEINLFFEGINDRSNQKDIFAIHFLVMFPIVFFSSPELHKKKFTKNRKETCLHCDVMSRIRTIKMSLNFSSEKLCTQTKLLTTYERQL